MSDQEAIKSINEIRANRADRTRANQTEARKLAPFKHQHRERQNAAPRRNWPVDARTLLPAPLDPGDVQMPPPPQPAPIAELQRQAETPAEAVDPQEVKALDQRRHREHVEAQDHANRFYGPWTPERVDEWLVEMNAVIIRMPVDVRPRGFTTARLPVVSEFRDVVAREENRSHRQLTNSVSHRWGPISTAEIRRADLAIMWCGQYLRHDPALARCVGLGARWKALGSPLKRRCKEVLGMWPSQFFKWRREGLAIIAAGLTKDGAQQ